MRVVITGASGNLGTALLRRLRAGDEAPEVVGVVRRPPDDVAPYDGVEWHAVDLAEPDAAERLAPAVAGADAVVHLAWLFQPSHEVGYLERTAVDGTRAVLEAADRAGVRHFVQLSSLGAYSPAPDGRRVDESWPTEGIPTLAYSLHKAAVERMLDDYEQAHPGGMAVARMRPGLVVQREAGSALLRYSVGPYVPAWLVGHLPLLPLDRSLVIQCVHTDDVADALARVLERRAAGAFNLAAEPPITRDRIAEVLRARAVHLPKPVLRTAADLTWRVRLQPLDPGWIDLAFGVPLMDTTRAREELGWEPRRDAMDALREAVDGMAQEAGTRSPVLRPRSLVGQLRRIARSGPASERRTT